MRSWYDPIVPAKRKISLSLDSDLVDELEHDTDEGLSSQVNVVLRAEVERRRRQRALRTLLDRLAREDGALTADDEAEIRRFERALSSGS